MIRPKNPPSTSRLSLRSLAGLDRGPDALLAQLGQLGVEVDLDVRLGQRLGQVGGPPGQAVLLGDPAQLELVAADQDRLGDDHRAVGGLQAALLADRHDGALEVLAQAHPAGDAVHHDADASLVHCSASREVMS
jgi:hypothetical protein